MTKRRIFLVLSIGLWSLVCLAEPKGAGEGLPKLPEEGKVVPLPAAVDSVTVGGGGRYLLFRIDKLSKVAIYDMTRDKITGYLPLSSTETLVAAGLKKVLLLAKDKGVLQRYNLENGQKELTVAVEFPGEIDNLVLGHASEGPAMVMTRQGPKFLSLATMKPIEMKGQGDGNWSPHPQYPLYPAVSADGQTFAAWNRGLSPSGIRILQLKGNTMVTHYAHESAGVLIPSWDGSLLFTGAGIFSQDLKPIAREQLQGKVVFPSFQPSYFVAIGFNDGDMSRERKKAPSVSIYSTGDRKLLVTLPAMEELAMDADARWGGNGRMIPSDRLFLAPQFERLVTVHDTRDKLTVRPFDILAVLDKSGIDYLFVDSLPVLTAMPGKAYKYAIGVKSKKGGVKYSLDSGPEGMKISPEGVLDWQVPANQEFEQVGVIVSIEDSAGQSIFHTFSIQAGIEPKKVEEPARALTTPRAGTTRPRVGPTSRPSF